MEPDGMEHFLEPGRRQAARHTNNRQEIERWPCPNRLPLTCLAHGGTIWARCNRRTCEGCAEWIAWLCAVRLRPGIEQVPPGRIATFFTLTFPRSKAPSDEMAQRVVCGR
jgi:hypothetical protein